MKTLINKCNPEIRITAPEIIEEEEYYTWDGEVVFLKDHWTLVEEEPTHTEVWVEGRTIFEQDAKKPEVDLEKEIEKKWNSYEIDEGYNGVEFASLMDEAFHSLCEYFYELGRKGGSND